MKSINYLVSFGFTLLCMLVMPVSKAQSSGKHTKLDTIKPFEIWPDADGNHIQAHGGGIIKIKKTYYWYGEQRGMGLDPKYRYVSCYSSKDLLNWKFRGNVVKMLPPDSISDKWGTRASKGFLQCRHQKNMLCIFTWTTEGIKLPR